MLGLRPRQFRKFEYTNIAAMITRQFEQTKDCIIKVIDASDDANIVFPLGETDLQAFYTLEKPKTGSINDYTLASAPYAENGTGSDTSKLASVAALKLTTGKALGDYLETNGYYANTRVGGALYKKVDPTGLTANDMDIIEAADGSFWKLQSNGTVNVYQFGALGNDNQTLIPYNRLVDNNQITLTEQTQDGISIDGALDYLEGIGGGVLHIPKGIFRTKGYQRDLNFSVKIIGDGIDISIIKSTDTSPTNVHGYGIFASYSDNARAITISDITLDGNGYTRTEPTAEFRSYNLALYGENQTVKLKNLKSINAVIDCLNIKAGNGENTDVSVTDCHFEDCYRNTVTVSAGHKVTFTDCVIKGGGVVHGGTNPRYCLDIEPNFGNAPVLNLKFIGCKFSKAINGLVGSSFGEADFYGCTFDGGSENPNPTDGSRDNYPWLVISSVSRNSFHGCTFKKEDTYKGIIKGYTDSGVGYFGDSQFLKLSDCVVSGAGIHAIAKNVIIHNTRVENSKIPVVCEGNETQRLEVDGLTLMNVLDPNNFGGGTISSFVIKNTVEGDVILNNILAYIDPDNVPTDFLPVVFDSPTPRTHGFYFDSSGGTNGIFKVTNVGAIGYYDKLPALLSLSENAANFRDWNLPNKAPFDISDNYLKKGVIYYKGCYQSEINPGTTNYLISKRFDTTITTGEELGGVLFQSNDADLAAGQETVASIVAVAESLITGSNSPVALSLRTRLTKTDAPIERIRISSEGVVTVNGIALYASGTTAQRPAGTKPVGLSYYNTTLGRMEWWNGTDWVASNGLNRVEKELDLPDWDMTSVFGLIVCVHGLSATEWKTIGKISTVIRNDVDDNHIIGDSLIRYEYDAVNIWAYRNAADIFDSADYNTAVGYSRGKLFFSYIPD